MPAITLTLDATQIDRVVEAFGSYWNLRDTQGQPRNATPAEVKAYLVRQVKAVVIQQERRKAENAIAPAAELVAI